MAKGNKKTKQKEDVVYREREREARGKMIKERKEQKKGVGLFSFDPTWCCCFVFFFLFHQVFFLVVVCFFGFDRLFFSLVFGVYYYYMIRACK
jgi:hypothetical protein